MICKPALCPACSGDLQLPDNVDVVKRMYCGVSIVVRQAIQQASVGNAKNWEVPANAAANAGNHAEAYSYFTRILEVDPDNSKAWFGKGAAAGWTSTLSSFRIPEMLTGFERAIECADPEKQTGAKHSAALEINQIVVAYYRLARKHLDNLLPSTKSGINT
jgi:hypothetical protein